MARGLIVRAFAKINLDLRVLGVRPDGYHELRTTFQSIALSDHLTFIKRPGPFRIECDDSTFPTDRSNLIWQAGELVMRLARRRDGISGITVRVDKNIPMQAGLGGGSSDAAAALQAFCRLLRVRLTADEMHHAAARLGADVPYFLHGGTALGFRRGDLLLPLDDIPQAWAVIVVPDFGVSTKDAFALWDQEVGVKPDPTSDRVASGVSRTRCANDLEWVVAKRHPEIRQLVRTLNKEGAFLASLSGSGSAVFGLFARRSAAQRAARALAGARTFLTPTLSRRACARLSAGAALART